MIHKGNEESKGGRLIKESSNQKERRTIYKGNEGSKGIEKGKKGH